MSNVLFVFGKFKYMKIDAGDDRVVEKSTLCFPRRLFSVCFTSMDNFLYLYSFGEICH